MCQAVERERARAEARSRGKARCESASWERPAGRRVARRRRAGALRGRAGGASREACSAVQKRAAKEKRGKRRNVLSKGESRPLRGGTATSASCSPKNEALIDREQAPQKEVSVRFAAESNSASCGRSGSALFSSPAVARSHLVVALARPLACYSSTLHPPSLERPTPTSLARCRPSPAPVSSLSSPRPSSPSPRTTSRPRSVRPSSPRSTLSQLQC